MREREREILGLSLTTPAPNNQSLKVIQGEALDIMEEKKAIYSVLVQNPDLQNHEIK